MKITLVINDQHLKLLKVVVHNAISQMTNHTLLLRDGSEEKEKRMQETLILRDLEILLDHKLENPDSEEDDSIEQRVCKLEAEVGELSNECGEGIGIEVSNLKDTITSLESRIEQLEKGVE